MNTIRSFRWLLVAGLTAVLVLPSRAEEKVAIPKTRLIELEQKEKELEALKAELARARGEQVKLKREKETAEAERLKAERNNQKLLEAKTAAETKAARAEAAAVQAEPPIAHDTPALATLPPLKKGDVVNALDLMNHYRADAAGAADRYGKQRIRVRGVVWGFDKPLFNSRYVVFLRTTERAWRLECTVVPDRELNATFVGQQGQTLMGVLRSGARLALARVGQTVEVEGEVKGLKDQALALVNGRLLVAE